MKKVLILFLKDLRVEFRRKETLLFGICFALMLAALAFFGVQSAYLRKEFEVALFPAFVWITFLFAGTLVQSRIFFSDTEHDALEELLLRGVSPEIIYLSKVLSSVCFLLLVFFFAFLSLLIFFNLSFAVIGPAILICSALVVTAFTFLSVLVAGININSKVQAILFPLLLFPFLFPVFFSGLELFASILVDRQFSWSNPWFSFILVINTLYFLLGYNLFHFAIYSREE